MGPGNEGTGSEGAGGRRPGSLPLLGWLDRPILGVAVVMAGAGFAQFSPAAALADVAEHFGDLRDTGSVAARAGLPGTVLGGGLAAIRIASLAALPLAGAADRLGRRRSLLLWVTGGLLLTIGGAASPGYWWFVAAFALARPLLTATDTIGEVVAAEHTGKEDRAKAIALMSAAYGVGAGAVAVLRAALGGPGFRIVFASAAIPLLLVLLARRLTTETARFRRQTDEGVPPVPVIGALDRRWRRRLVVLAVLAFASGLITGPVNTLLFVYAENVLDLSPTFTGVLVVAAAPVGLTGLLVGRFAADRAGRRPSGAAALVALAGAGVLAYTGSTVGLVTGYLLSVLVGAGYSVAAIALATELFPTSVRATVAGWLVVAGIVGATTGLLVVGYMADTAQSFTAALAVVCLPAALAAPLVALVPETAGTEPEDAWAEKAARS